MLHHMTLLLHPSKPPLLLAELPAAQRVAGNALLHPPALTLHMAGRVVAQMTPLPAASLAALALHDVILLLCVQRQAVPHLYRLPLQTKAGVDAIATAETSPERIITELQNRGPQFVLGRAGQDNLLELVLNQLAVLLPADELRPRPLLRQLNLMANTPD